MRAFRHLQGATRPGARMIHGFRCSARLQYTLSQHTSSYRSWVHPSAGPIAEELVGGQQVMLNEQALLKRDVALNEANIALKQASNALKGANHAQNEAISGLNEARSAVYEVTRDVRAAAEDIRNAQTDNEHADARQRELNAMQERDKAEQMYEKAKQAYEKAEQAKEVAKQAYEEVKKDDQNMFSQQRELAIAFRDCIPSESILQITRALARMIKKGEDDFQSLEYQREALKLPGLQESLPYVCNANMQMKAGMLFVQRVSPSIHQFKDAVHAVSSGSPQQRRMLVVAQASGSGKTKLAYDVSVDSGILSVVASVAWPKHSGLALPFDWLAAVEPALREAEVPYGVKNETELLMTFRDYLFVVVLVAHIEWAAHVAEELHALQPRQWSQVDVNRAILRATSNGIGQSGIAQLVSERLAGIPHIRKVESEANLVLWAERYVQTATKKLEDAHRALLGGSSGTRSPSILVTIDEAPKLMTQEFNTGEGSSANWLRGASEALAVLMEQNVASCVTGTFFDVARLLDNSVSPLRGHTHKFNQVVNITSADLWQDMLRRHLPSLPETIPASLQVGLERLEGRPVFLFDELLLIVLDDLVVSKPHLSESKWPCDIQVIEDPSARRFAGFLYSRLSYAWETSVTTMVERIEKFVAPSQNTGRDDSYLLQQLLNGVFLQGGQLPVLTAKYGNRKLGNDKKIMEDAVRQGLLVYDPTGRGSVLQEPVTVEAVRRVARERALSNDVYEDEWLETTRRVVADWSSAKGAVFEHAFACMLIRACNGNADGVKLQKALADVVPLGFVTPESVRDKVLRITGASPVPMVGNGSKMDDWRAMSGTSTIWHGFHKDAGLDLMLRTTDGTVVGVQAKSGRVRLADAVASCSLGWQYMSRKPVPGQPFMFSQKPGETRRQFLDHAPIVAGEEHLRLVFSVKGFSQSAVDAANAYNELRPQSAILLCQSSEAALGPLHGALSDLTDVTTIELDHSEAAAALIVHQDVVGESELRGGGQSFSEWLVAEKKKRG